MYCEAFYESFIKRDKNVNTKNACWLVGSKSRKGEEVCILALEVKPLA